MDRAGLPFAQLLDQRDALLKLRAPRFELLHLLNDALQARGLALRVGDLLIELAPTRSAATSTTSPPSSAVATSMQAAADGDLLADLELRSCAWRARDRRQGG